MGWFLGCFGCGGGSKQRLPSPASRAAGRRHNSSSHPRPRSVAAAAPAGNPWIRNGGEPLTLDSNGLRHLRIPDEQWRNVQETEQASKHESSGISLETPHERKAPRWDSSPELSPVSGSNDSSNSSSNNNNVARLSPAPTRTAAEAEIAPEDRDDKKGPAVPSAVGTAATNSKPVCAEQVSLSLVPRAPPTFFMLPRKRSFAYRSSMWQEPLSPVAEAECSGVSSSEERDEEADELPSRVKQEESPSCSSSSASVHSSKTSLISISPSACDAHEELRSDGSDAEITPVRCMSPVVVRKKVEAPRNVVSKDKDKENAFLRNNSPMEVVDSGHHHDSVLTPVGNVLQWRQLKEEQWQRNNNENKRAAEQEKEEAEEGEEDEGQPVKVSSPTPSSESNDLDIEPENYSFFSELQWSSTQITPPVRPTPTSRWDGDDTSVRRIPNLWDGQGIPNTTRKYKEDQQVTWHSTPFEARIDKALASSRQLRPTDAAAAPRTTLF